MSGCSGSQKDCGLVLNGLDHRGEDVVYCECVHVWRASLAEPMLYDFVWVLEDDVGFSGNLSDLVFAYANDESDLVTGSHITKPMPFRPVGKYNARDYGYGAVFCLNFV